MIVYGFSRDEFVNYLKISDITEENIEQFTNEYFISILPSGGPKSIPVFSQQHYNALTIQFDDVEEDSRKWGGDVQMFIEAKAITDYQATILLKFIDTIPESARVNIHCVYGVSRTGSVAKFLQEYRNAQITVKDPMAINNRVFSLLKHISTLR